MKFLQISFVFIVATLLSVCSGYRILGVFPFNVKSHNIIFEAVLKGLAKHGHQVDVVTHFPLKKPLRNYNDIISLEGSMERLMNNFTHDFISKVNDDVVYMIGDFYGNRLCEFLAFEKIQNLIKNPPKDPPYDVILTEAFGAHCYMGLGYVFNVPVVAVCSSMEYPWISNYIGNVDNLAIVPNFYRIGVGRMNFWQRMKNVITNFISVRKFHTITGDVQTEAMRKYLKPDMPHIREVEKNVALTLVNNHHTIFGVKPITPSMVQIAGLHIEMNDETLPSELKKWMDESSHGVVYFTLGSMVLIETFPTKQLEEIFDSFKKIAPTRVLMKIVDSSKLPLGLPENVKVLPWIPQLPVLAHPNTKIFFTHCGLGGLQEALYHGVPLIGMPLFGDQFRNAEAFREKGVMFFIDYNQFSKKSLDSALQALLKDPVYTEKAKHHSKLFRDQPLKSMENAIFWIEYVIRNGGHVLKSPATEFTWWQLAQLDIYGSILLAMILSLVSVIFIIRLLVKFITRKLCGKKQKKKKVH